MAVERINNGDNGLPVPNYVDDNVIMYATRFWNCLRYTKVWLIRWFGGTGKDSIANKITLSWEIQLYFVFEFFNSSDEIFLITGEHLLIRINIGLCLLKRHVIATIANGI